MHRDELIALLGHRTAVKPAALDREVYAYFCEQNLKWTWRSPGPDYDGKNGDPILVPPNLPKDFTYPPKGRISPLYHVPPDERLTADLADPALALVRKVLPGAFWVLGYGKVKAGEPPYGCQLLFGHEEIIGNGEGPTIGIAICLALFDATNGK